MGNRLLQEAKRLGLDKDVGPSETILIIGDLARWNAQGRGVVSYENFKFSEFGSLTAPLFANIAPTVVLSPLVGDNFDVIDVAIRLTELKYGGRYRVIADDLPNEDMIRKEVRAHAPDLDFDLLTVPRAANDG